jgi:hypothetical protein
MNLTRRGLAAGGAAAAIGGSIVAFGQQQRPDLASPNGASTVLASADGRDFEAALRAKFARGDVLNWTGDNVTLRQPITIDVTESMVGPGVDLNGAKIFADFNDAQQRALTIRIPTGSTNIALRGLKIVNGTFIARSPALDAVGLVCLTNRSWIYSWKFIDLDIEHFARDGLFFDGSVFEGECHAVTCADNGRNGMTFRNDGPKNDMGIVSAIAIFGGQMPKNGNAGIETQSALPFQQPRDLNLMLTYFVENKGPGLHAAAGFSMAQGCGFENNAGCGIRMTNEGRLYACRASTYGSQPYLLEAFLNGGEVLIDGCRIEGYGGFEDKMKLAKVRGRGIVNVRASGARPAVELTGDLTLKET